MTYRPSEVPSKDCYSQSESRLNQQIRKAATKEGCPVIEESGSVCGETSSLTVFQEFRQIYDDCIKKLESSPHGNVILARLTPLRKLIEDLWEQNTMLVETVEELEQEAAAQVTTLQDKLNKSCEKILEYEEDIGTLMEIIRRYKDCGVLDFSGVKLNTLSISDFGRECDSRCTAACNIFRDRKRHRILSRSSSRVPDCIIPSSSSFLADKEKQIKAKDRELECLNQELSEKDELIKKYCSEVDGLKKDMKAKNKKHKQILFQLKSTSKKEYKNCVEGITDEDLEDFDTGEFEEVLVSLIKDLEEQRDTLTQQFQNAERELKAVNSERKMFPKERTELYTQLQSLTAENKRLEKVIADQKGSSVEKDELLKTIAQLKSEKNELVQKISTLHSNIQELNTNFKETRWALTSEVAEKHDQVQELRRCLGVLEEQLRQADMQTHFKDDIIKELRKELRNSRKSISNLDSKTNQSLREFPSKQLQILKPVKAKSSDKNAKEDESKIDLHNLPGSEGDMKPKKYEKSGISVEVQTEPCRSISMLKTRHVSTQHTTRVQKLPRSFGTLTVTPWSGASGEVISNEIGLQCLKEAKKNLKGIYTVPYSRI